MARALLPPCGSHSNLLTMIPSACAAAGRPAGPAGGALFRGESPEASGSDGGTRPRSAARSDCGLGIREGGRPKAGRRHEGGHAGTKGCLCPVRIASSTPDHVPLTISEPQGCTGLAVWRWRSYFRRRASPPCGRCVDGLPAMRAPDRRPQVDRQLNPAAARPRASGGDQDPP